MLFKSKQFKTVYKALVLAVILIIPVIYCCTYLGSLWNPYGNLNKLPVAVVNYDTGALIDGENRNLGDEICDKMTQEQTLNFVITDENSAAYGTEHGEYYATIVIPKDTSTATFLSHIVAIIVKTGERMKNASSVITAVPASASHTSARC